MTREDWIGSATLLARYAPGFGNPWKLTIDVWMDALDMIAFMFEQQTPARSDPRSHVENEMRRRGYE